MQAVADMKPSQTSWRRELSMKEFTHLAQIVQGLTGIRLPEQKRIMMEARLQKRLRRLGLDSFAAYLTFLESGEEGEQEIVELVNAMTTNKTDFFREADHFEVLYNRILPAVDTRRRQDRPFRVWSASCSTGEEPYTLAIVLSEYAAEHPDFEFEIVATDISTRVLGIAREATYTAEQVSPIPEHLLKRYFMRHKNPSAQLYRVIPELRAKVTFEEINLIHDDFRRFGIYDAVFCRNTLMYFGPELAELVLGKLCSHVVRGGHVFVGHAEMRTVGGLPLRTISPAAYVRT